MTFDLSSNMTKGFGHLVGTLKEGMSHYSSQSFKGITGYGMVSSRRDTIKMEWTVLYFCVSKEIRCHFVSPNLC